jgi:hypothetical protein
MKLVLIIYLGTIAIAFPADINVQPLSVALFGGGQRSIALTLNKVTQQSIDRELTLQLVQASSTTIAPVQTIERWKRVVLMSNQSMKEDAVIEIPNVRAATRFLLRLAADQSVIGTVDVWAYPSNLLAELTKSLAGEPIVLCDTPHEWKPAFDAAGVRSREVMPDRLASTEGKLAVVGPLVGEPHALKIKQALQKKVLRSVIILRNPPSPEAAILPSYYLSHIGNTRIVFAIPELVTNLLSDPWSQLRFVQMAKLATGSEDLITSEFSH